MFIASFSGMKVETEFDAIQPVGFTAAIKAAQQRITATRSNPSTPHDIPIIAIENFLLEIGQNTWYDLGVIILEDIKQKINLQTFTQMTPVPSQIVKTAQESTPINYSSNGFSVSIGSLMGTNLQVCLKLFNFLNHYKNWEICFILLYALLEAQFYSAF